MSTKEPQQADQSKQAPPPPSPAELQASVDELQAITDRLARQEREEHDVRARTEEPGQQPPSRAHEMEMAR